MASGFMNSLASRGMRQSAVGVVTVVLLLVGVVGYKVIHDDLQWAILIDKLSTDAGQIPSKNVRVRGEIVSASEYALEPGYVELIVRVRDGSVVDIVTNDSAAISWPGSAQGRVVRGYRRDVGSPMTMNDYRLLSLDGVVRVARIGKPMMRRSQAFLVRGTLTTSTP